MASGCEHLLPATAGRLCLQLVSQALPGSASEKLMRCRITAAAAVGDSTGVASHRSVDGMEVAEGASMTRTGGATPERVRWLRSAKRRSRG